MCYVSYETVHFEWVWLQNLNEPTGGNITPTTVTGILLQSKKNAQHTIKLQFVIVKEQGSNTWQVSTLFFLRLLWEKENRITH